MEGRNMHMLIAPLPAAVAAKKKKENEMCIRDRLETILPAPESAHAIFQAVEEAKRCAETGEEKTILFGLTGTGYFDMKAYDAYNRGEMSDHVPTDEELEVGFASIPHIEGVQ